jgi:3-oxoadipate enol-lactonase
MTVSTPRGEFEVRRTGDAGPHVLLLHPLALAGSFWEPLASHLGRSATVLAWDARGHGSSSWDGGPFTIEDMADDAAAVIEAAAGGGPVSVLGMSMGGCTAIALAQRHPELVDRLVLADTTACYGPDREKTWEERAQNAQNKPRTEQVPFQVTRWFSDGFREEQPAAVQRVVDIFTATDSAAHAAASRAMGAFDGTPGLDRITADTLVVVGEEDYATPPAMAQVLAEGIPGARLEVLESSRHLSLLERPDYWPSLARHLGLEGSAS